MAGVLEGVDQRTNLIGENRMELLLFELNGRQQYGINVFKVQEVLTCPSLTNIPQAHPVMRGFATIRGKTIPVLDLGMAIGLKPVEDITNSYMIISEYNRSIQGFLVKSVDRIINMNWDKIQPPPKGVGKNNYMTAVTEIDGKLVEIIDVEKVLAEMTGLDIGELENFEGMDSDKIYNILIVDDSSVARKQIQRTLEQLGMNCILAENGKEGLEKLKEMASSDVPLSSQVDLIVSDIEMPVMDGYTFVTSIRGDERLKDLKVLMHTSMSGTFNDSMIKKVGADKFIPKFKADELAAEVKSMVEGIS